MTQCISAARLLLLVGLACVSALSCSESTGPGAEEPDVSGYWEFWMTPGWDEQGPRCIEITQVGATLTFTHYCYPDMDATPAALTGSTITFEALGPDSLVCQCSGTVTPSSMSGVYAAGDSVDGTWRAERMAVPPDSLYCVVSSVSVFCVRFPDDSYVVEANVYDPDHDLDSVEISGSQIEDTSPLLYDIYPEHPGEWWTNPNIFICQGVEPDFPLNYTVHLHVAGADSEDVTRTVTDWEWAQ